MQKEDYILREIEKIGIMLQMLIRKLVATQEKLPEQYDIQLNEVKAQLEHIGFNLDEFLQLDRNKIESHLKQFDGMRGPNLELLGDLMRETGMGNDPSLQKSCLERALDLYELCNALDRTYSFEREDKINQIKTMLQ